MRNRKEIEKELKRLEKLEIELCPVQKTFKITERTDLYLLLSNVRGRIYLLKWVLEE